MGAGNGKRVMDTGVQGLPCERTRPIRDLGNSHYERAHLHGRGNPEVIKDQPDGNVQGVVVVALRLELSPHLRELPLKGCPSLTPKSVKI